MSLSSKKVYWIKSIHSGKCLDVSQEKGKKNGTLIIYDYGNSPNQQFVLRHSGHSYVIVNTLTGKALTIDGDANSSESCIREMEDVKGDNQRWRILETDPDSGEYVIAAFLSDKVLDVCHEKKSNCTPVILYDYKKSHNQIWHFIDADDGEYPLKPMGTSSSSLSKS